MGVESPQPVINETTLALNFTNEGGVCDTIRLLKNITGLWVIQESRRAWLHDGQQSVVGRDRRSGRGRAGVHGVH